MADDSPEYPDDAEHLNPHDTRLGFLSATEEFDTMGYSQHGWWQTTIPYWVELFGPVGEAKDIPEITGKQFGTLPSCRLRVRKDASHVRLWHDECGWPNGSDWL